MLPAEEGAADAVRNDVQQGVTSTWTGNPFPAIHSADRSRARLRWVVQLLRPERQHPWSAYHRAPLLTKNKVL